MMMTHSQVHFSCALLSNQTHKVPKKIPTAPESLAPYSIPRLVPCRPLERNLRRFLPPSQPAEPLPETIVELAEVIITAKDDITHTRDAYSHDALATTACHAY